MDTTISPIKKGDTLRFSMPGQNQEVEGRVLSRAGKVGGVYQKWWNIHNNETGEEQSYDTEKFESVRKIRVADDENIEEVFVVQIPRYLHNEPRCLEAKEKELNSWDEFDVFEEVPDIGQETLGTNGCWLKKLLMAN